LKLNATSAVAEDIERDLVQPLLNVERADALNGIVLQSMMRTQEGFLNDIFGILGIPSLT